MADQNKVRIRGTIVGMNFSVHEASIRIATEGERRRGGGEDDGRAFPDVIFADVHMLEDYRPRMRVEVVAHMQTRRVLDDEGNARFYTVFFGDQIRPAKRLLASIYDDIPEEGGYVDDMNLALFEGTVSRVYAPAPQQGRTPICYLTLQIHEENKRMRHCSIVCFGHQAVVASQCSVGDRIALAGIIRTRREGTGANAQNIMTMICRDIQKLLDAPKKQEETEDSEAEESPEAENNANVQEPREDSSDSEAES